MSRHTGPVGDDAAGSRAGGGALIELRQVGFAVTSPVPTRILHPLDLDIAAGTAVAIIGPSGAGKTTLASLIGALQQPSEGSYRYAGWEMTGRNLGELASFRSRRLGFVFQNSHLIDERSALANVDLGITDPRVPGTDRRRRCWEALDTVGLAEVAERKAAHLSGGERHRVAVARALVKQPEVVIADEPTAALDQATGQSILDLLSGLTDGGTTLIVVTHDARAAGMADQVVSVVDGRLT
ncbi:MAG: ABC transporter ATP-binding protein [Micropruina sp.]|uniref:ABC transporter ATP-binding protein n=1 Tax=Micropruina sp. TaxID=2737536 RepID=UPI0039E495B4